ncbi:phage tail protein [Actinokineospora diospyrosa]|uniref:Phage tail protein, P2 protein I family n=1 Tax=Actinokineospora diospyrosa TaxID=103728 RepID=A0ABT1IFY8_9PSEU|nr:phage tail protein [Actinokineospora diospyrosa]MCP2271488.1 phage tail protein, P2 protein I family [Actinokineospora diospyrosa]
MRTASADVPVRHPIGERLPAIYAENEFTQRFTAALDEVIAPLFAVLDSFADYFDPALAAPDFLDWLSSWVALEADEGWGPRQRRDLIGAAVAMHRRRGTVDGLARQVELLTGGAVEVTDTGGCVANAEHGGPLPGADPGQVRVLVRVADPAAVDPAAVRASVAESVPVHLRVAVEVVGGAPAGNTNGSGT